MSKKLKCAILGFGGMGHFHANQYVGQKDVELVALCDIDRRKLDSGDATINLGNSGAVDSSKLRKYACYDEMLAGERGKLDIVDICLPAHLHCEYAIRAMKDGLDVLCEKPMALNSKDCARMIAAQKKSGRRLMVAQCLRFSAEYILLGKLIRTRKYGRLLRLEMSRLSNYPSMSSPWYHDVKTSGGAILDLHLHDIDWLQSMFGLPSKVAARGVIGRTGGWDEILSMPEFADPDASGAMISVAGSWLRDRFQARFVAVFERGQLVCDNGVRIRNAKGNETKVELPPSNMYFNEIAYFAKCARTGKDPVRCMPASTMASVKFIERERAAAARR